MSYIANNVLELIGNTPMIKITKLTRKNDATILAKLERFNPGGSIKDRIAKYIIEKAEKEGRLTKDKILLEATSGNTGIALAMVAAVKGYKCLIIMPKNASEERKVMIKAFGAKTIFTSTEVEAIELANKIVKKNPKKYFLLNQFGSLLNPLAHYETTGKEIIEQTRGKIDMFIATIGTTGTLIGVGKRLKEFNPNIKIVAVEPFLNEAIPGLLNLKEFTPPIFDKSIIDEKINVSLKNSIRMAKRIARKEGLFVGISSGAAMWAAAKKARELGKGKVIVTIFPDLGERYISLGYFK
jgi:cysteinyl-tRNA synthetase